MNQKIWTIKDILDTTSDYLKKKEIDSPRLCAEVLLANLLNRTRVNLYLTYDQPLSERELGLYRSLIKRRVQREPLQYITGLQEFWSLSFKVGPQVLIPRPESELLVEQVVSLFKDRQADEKQGFKILDMCTGSGAIGISLAREFSDITVWACDISKEAIEIAELNAENHGVEDRMRFIHGDLFEPFLDQFPGFNIIVTNPPYVSSEEYGALPPEVRDYEPRSALDGHKDGLYFIERIIAEAPEYLVPGGFLLIEMDPRQTAKALSLLDDKGCYTEACRVKDYNNQYRIVSARKK